MGRGVFIDRLHRFYKKIFLGHDEFQGIGYKEYLQMAREILTNQVSNEMYEYYQVGMADHFHEAMIYFSENSLKGNVAEFKGLV